tara:strand:+ start:116 stop:1303 length:1188 start_codon:yes stop_codon:yes gene_type:complete
MTINKEEEIFNLRSLILYIKSNLVTVIIFIFGSVFLSSLYFFTTPQEYKATINIIQKADLENNLISSNIADSRSSMRYDYTTEKLFKLFETNIQDERKIENLYQAFQLQNDNIYDGLPDQIFSNFSFRLRPEYLIVSIQTGNKEFTNDFLKFVIPELNEVVIGELVNQLNNDFNYQNVIKEKFYEIEKNKRITQLKVDEERIVEIKDDASIRKTIILDMLDESIIIAETLGWQVAQIDILSSLSHKDENRISIDEGTETLSQFLSSTFNSYPAYLFGYDILKSVRKSVIEETTKSSDNVIFNEIKNLSALERESNNVYMPQLEREYFEGVLNINFIQDQMKSQNFRIVNYNLSSIVVENSKSIYLLYFLIAVFFGFILSLLFLFIRDLSITNSPQ